MRENYRKSIASIEKLPQFTTMNVIDGQAGIIICSSLIFYSLTIDNILNIIVLLILAGVSIATLTGENGILTQANNAKTQTEIADEKEAVEMAATYAITKGEINKPNLDEELNNRPGTGNYTSEVVDEGIAVTFKSRSYLVDSNGNVTEYIIREPEETPDNSTLATLSQMKYGVIETEFLKGTGYNVNTTPNEPILKDGMKAVYWAKDASGEIDTENPANNTYEITSDDSNFKKENWYSYTAQNSTTENGGSSRWANAMTSDGSYYVWIPRYSYRIIYFNSQANENAYRAGTLTEEDALKNGYITGYSDSRGIVDSEGKRPTSVSSTTAISVNDKKLRTHPVFDGNTDEGGWDSKLTGIWVMKYEASRPTATASSNGSGTIPKSVPNVKSWVSTDVSTMFTYAKNAYNNGDILNTTLNSHMMKNSEWGAVAYLTDSKYGRNGTEISVNQCSTYITGAGRGLNSTEDSSQTGTSTIYNSTYSWSSVTDNQKYNGTVGKLSSTTGNVYGIYDISGGSSECVMGFYGTDNNTPTYGSSRFTTDTFPSENKYYQIYLNSTNSYSNANGGILGDATKETKGWNSDYPGFVDSTCPVFLRGGFYTNSYYAGSFSFFSDVGFSDSSNSFRVSLAVQ